MGGSSIFILGTYVRSRALKETAYHPFLPVPLLNVFQPQLLNPCKSGHYESNSYTIRFYRTTHAEPRSEMRSRKLIHEDYRLGWICTLDCEIKAARALLDEEHEPLQPGCRDDNGYILGCYGSHNVVIACSSVSGTTATARTATNLVRSFPNIQFGLLVGIGGAVPSSPHPSNPVRDIHLGDVVVSEPKGSHGKCP